MSSVSHMASDADHGFLDAHDTPHQDLNSSPSNSNTHGLALAVVPDVPLLDFLAKDRRPTFVIDAQGPRLAFQNDALSHYLDQDEIEQHAFTAWTLSTPFTETTIESFSGRTWSSTVLQQRWIIVSAACCQPHAATANYPPSTSAPMSPGHDEVGPLSAYSLPPFRYVALSMSGSEGDVMDYKKRAPSISGVSSSWRGSSEDGIGSPLRNPRQYLDWTKQNMPGLSAHIQRIREYRWDLTPVGAMVSWSDSLRQVVLAMMSNSEPRIVMWGVERRMIYNEASSLLFGQKHPLALGARAEEVWAESWHDLVHIVRRAEWEGKSTRVAKMPLTMRRHGFLEETYWTLQMIPVVGPNGQVLGVLDEFAEITDHQVSERRREAIVRVNQAVTQVSYMKELCFEFLEGIEACREDVPFALIYTLPPASDSDAGCPEVVLEGSVGIQTSGLPKSFQIGTAEDGRNSLENACKRAWRSAEDLILSTTTGDLPEELAVTIPGRAQGAKVGTVCVLPVMGISGSGQVVSLLVIAMSPRRPYDADSLLFAHHLRDIFIKSASAIVLPEEQRRTRQRFEEIETSLAQQLRASALEAEKIEARFARMTRTAPIGMYAISPTGDTLFFNDAYLSITGLSRQEAEGRQQIPSNTIHPEDQERVSEIWRNCLETKQPFTCEYRVNKPYFYLDPATGEELVGESWILGNGTPDLDENGNVEHVRGWLVDISERKHMEHERVKRAHNEQAEARFARLAETAPLGMYLLHVDGRPIYLNDAYFEMLGFTRSDFEEAETRGLGWADRIHEDDRQRVGEAWTSLIQDGVPLNLEYRIKKPWKAYDTNTGTEMIGETWLQGTAVAEQNEEGVPIAVQGFVTDISLKKFSERLLMERLDDALETKQQADRFIDMVSHEIRNPLSAILQSADGVLSCLESVGLPILHEGMTLTNDHVETVVDSAQTIILCAQHQKRIVDDILTLSKLDSNLLIISPDKVSPPLLLEKTIKMYEAELTRSDIKASLILEPSYEELGVDEVMLDSSRLLQVVINLFTNAIKFTQYSDIRELRAYLSASRTRPTHDRHGTAFIPPRPNRPDHSSSPEWGSGGEIYLQVAVEDTGRGLSEDELKLLFQRFHQASPKTYKQYGGSGLGLFISRELSELQGGQIGVHSEAGKGSTFSFYVKARRCVLDHPAPLIPDRRLPTPTLNESPVTYARAGSVASVEGTAPDPEHPSRQPSHAPGSVKRASMSSATRPSQLHLGPLHVLVVEDNLVNQRVMAQQLKRLGCVVHVANHGVEALDFLQRTIFWNQQPQLEGSDDMNDTSNDNTTSHSTAVVHDPSSVIPLSVVLMDLEMPVLGGLGCVKQIRDFQRSGHFVSHVPVIAVTANARSEQIAIAIEHGMDSVVTKPFRIPELVPQMLALVGRVKAEGGGEGM